MRAPLDGAEAPGEHTTNLKGIELTAIADANRQPLAYVNYTKHPDAQSWQFLY